eukprot:CAMPEP_0117878614 /NCGR_PEP_ID=MMETSP0950-20121206/14964_1 /TAXON_ID=44440 /ORGANISM="Chattonella subsalsa, Strain CCMP2191" /LENGTH=79 /DNA_ID=CAMNT_0005732973 /DNA_START=1090 /DNA_END=1326 /DNA_ORIENTATION=+
MKECKEQTNPVIVKTDSTSMIRPVDPKTASRGALTEMNPTVPGDTEQLNVTVSNASTAKVAMAAEMALGISYKGSATSS